MTNKEKAKAYDEALALAKSYYGKGTNEFLDTIFPELAESEDERIRKFLVKHVSKWIGCIEHDLKLSSGDVESEEELAMFKAGLAYLEKQKEQNIYKSSKSEVDFADRYSRDVWEELMSKFKAVEGYSIGCNDVSDIVLNAILDAFKWQKGQPADAKSERVIKAARRVLNNWLDGTDCPDVSGDFTELEYAIRKYDGVEKLKESEPTDPSDEELQRHQDELYDFKVFATKQAKEHHISVSFVHDFEWNNFCAELLSYFNEKQKPAEWSDGDEEIQQ